MGAEYPVRALVMPDSCLQELLHVEAQSDSRTTRPPNIRSRTRTHTCAAAASSAKSPRYTCLLPGTPMRDSQRPEGCAVTPR
jgi:hypothetical protein